MRTSRNTIPRAIVVSTSNILSEIEVNHPATKPRPECITCIEQEALTIQNYLKPVPLAVLNKNLAAHVMFDLETLGTGSDALILSVGMVVMNDAYEIIASNEWTIDWEKSRAAHKFSFNHSTFLWWLEQNPQARERLVKATKFTLFKVLQELSTFVLPWDDVEVWSNGAAFDIPILENAFKRIHVPVPWKHWNVRCFRTIKNLYKDVKHQHDGVAHGALDDARSQSIHLKKLLNPDA